MARDITAGVISELDAQELSPIFLIRAEFDSGDVNFWTGYGSLSYGGNTYTGSGHLLDIEGIRETQELVANGVDVTLSGLPTSLVALALSENYQGRPLTIDFAVLDSDAAIIADPYQCFKGRMDVMLIEDDGREAKITVTSESDLIGLRDNKERRYTDEDQQAEYPGDLGFEFVSLSQDVTLTWGAGRSS